MSSTNQNYNWAKKRGGDKFDWWMTRGNISRLVIFISILIMEKLVELFCEEKSP